jgi:hypothetical protein
VALTRDLALGRQLDLPILLFHLGVLVALVGVGVFFALRTFHKRLVV